MKVEKLWKVWGAGALLAAAAATPAAASTTLCHALSGGGITVNECSDSSTSGWYDVINGSQQAIVAFAVSTQVNASFAEAFSERPGWRAMYMSEAMWNERYGAGSFDTYFGTADTGAFFYFAARPEFVDDTLNTAFLPYKPMLILPGDSTEEEFFFNATPKSNFVAFSSFGPVSTPFAGSLISVSSVPEPEAYALALCGLGALAVLKRRRRQEPALAA